MAVWGHGYRDDEEEGYEMPNMARPKLLSWGSDVEEGTLDQAAMAAQLPFVMNHVALMPDAHIGMGATIGSVIPTVGAIIPAAVGVDIGCGMIAVETSLMASDLPDDLTSLHHSISRSIPAGVGRGHHDTNRAGELIAANDNVQGLGLADRAAAQMGTLGSGNHFVEVCLDRGDRVWVVLHSGSRGVGNKLAMRHIKTAKGLMKRYFIELDDLDLAYFVEGTREFGEYMTDLHWAQDYALANRETMMGAVLKDLAYEVGKPFKQLNHVNCHHNYTAKEHHYGKDVWVTRKGAIRARVGDYGVIPGSMGTNSYIVRGLGNKSSFDSSAHGAGRRMSRSRARRELEVSDLEVKMDGKAWNSGDAKALLDEHPDSYKDIESVMRDQADLVEIVTELHQVLNYKGT